MKKLIYSIAGAVIAICLCIGAFWLAGHFFGPLYQSEDEANRNFGIFMICFSVALIGGGVIGYKIAAKRGREV